MNQNHMVSTIIVLRARLLLRWRDIVFAFLSPKNAAARRGALTTAAERADVTDRPCCCLTRPFIVWAATAERELESGALVLSLQLIEIQLQGCRFIYRFTKLQRDIRDISFDLEIDSKAAVVLLLAINV